MSVIVNKTERKVSVVVKKAADGKDFKYEDFTPEQLEALEAKVTAENIEGALGFTPASDLEIVHKEGSEIITGAKTFKQPTGFHKEIVQETEVINNGGLSVGAYFGTKAKGGIGTQLGAVFANVTTLAGETELPELEGILTALYHSEGFNIPTWKGIETGAAFIDGTGSSVTNAWGIQCKLPVVTNGGAVTNAAAIYIPSLQREGIENVYAIYSPSVYPSVFGGSLELENSTGENVKLYSGSDILVFQIAPNGLQIRDNAGNVIHKITGGETNIGGTENNNTFTKPPLVLSGFNQVAGAEAYGDYGGLVLNANGSYTSSSRRFLITNALGGSKFAIIRSINSTTDPAIDSTAITSGTADFVINNLGNIGIGKESPTAKLDVEGSGKFSGVVTTGSGATRPTIGLSAGSQFFDTTLGKPIWYNGSAWVDAMGTVV